MQFYGRLTIPGKNTMLAYADEYLMNLTRDRKGSCPGHRRRHFVKLAIFRYSDWREKNGDPG